MGFRCLGTASGTSARNNKRPWKPAEEVASKPAEDFNLPRNRAVADLHQAADPMAVVALFRAEAVKALPAAAASLPNWEDKAGARMPSIKL